MKKDGLALEPDVYALLTTTPNAPAKSINHTTDLKRYLLGTKNKKLIRNSGGSLTLYTGARSPGGEKEANWLPAPVENSRSTSERIGEEPTLDGSWQPPKKEKANPVADR